MLTNSKYIIDLTEPISDPRTKLVKYRRSGNFNVCKFSRISDFGTFHEVYNSRIFIVL